MITRTSNRYPHRRRISYWRLSIRMQRNYRVCQSNGGNLVADALICNKVARIIGAVWFFS